MPSARRIGDLSEALRARRFPTVTVFNRVEGRPRSATFDRALKAEVRDALWMLTKQWQLGEFRGSDAGSPVAAKVRVDSTRLTKYRPGETGATEAFDYGVPLEAEVERRPVPLRSGGRPVALDVRLMMGRRWLKQVDAIGPYRAAFVDAYGIDAPDPADPADAGICAHPQEWEVYAAVAGHAMDGGRLYEHLRAGAGNHAYDGVAGIAPGDQAALDAAADRFLAWFDRLILQPPPEGDDAWSPPRLEYRFAASAPLADGSERVYVAEEYAEGRLDWYSVDVGAAAAPLDPIPGAEDPGLPPDGEARTMIPVPVSFAGMPATRWWAFEEGRTNFGDIDANTTDLAKLLFLEFALVYANDWFVIPYTLPVGAIAQVRGVAVTNTFGERLWVDAAGAGADDDWQRWSMFESAVDGAPGAAADTSLLLLPTVAKSDEGQPLEDVSLIRDEVANMVWGIETTVPLPSGATAQGIEAAQQLRGWFEAQVPPPPAPPAPVAPVRYRVMTTVPENWIPFVPVHVEGDTREIQLQRAALPRIVEGDPQPPVKVRPRTSLLRDGLDRTPAAAYFLHEEEVPRAGARVFQAYQRTRWTSGRTFTWLGARRQTGRGEGSSALRFDSLQDTPPAP